MSIICIACFLEFDDLICNPPSKVLVTCRLHADVDDNNEEIGQHNTNCSFLQVL